MLNPYIKYNESHHQHNLNKYLIKYYIHHHYFNYNMYILNSHINNDNNISFQVLISMMYKIMYLNYQIKNQVLSINNQVNLCLNVYKNSNLFMQIHMYLYHILNIKMDNSHINLFSSHNISLIHNYITDSFCKFYYCINKNNVKI